MTSTSRDPAILGPANASVQHNAEPSRGPTHGVRADDKAVARPATTSNTATNAGYMNDHAVPKERPRRRRRQAFGARIIAAKGPKATAAKNHLVAMIGEYVGTTMFLLIALGGTQVANIPTTTVSGATSGATQAPNTSSLLYIALSFGFSLAVNAWIFFRVSGGLFNPAISFAMTIAGVLPPIRGALLIVSQILGGITGTAIIQALLPGTLYVQTKLSGGTSIAQGLFLEMFLTAMLMITIFLLAVDKSKATFIAPIGIGLALFICELVGVYYTGGSLNPARSFGPDVVLKNFTTYHWIYWVGPGLGSILAAGFYKLLKMMHFETANPGQDAAEAAEEKIAARTTDIEANAGNEETGSLPHPRTAQRSKSPLTRSQGPGLGDLDTKKSKDQADGNQLWLVDPQVTPDNQALSDQLHRMELLLQTLMDRNGLHDGKGATKLA